MGAPKGNQNAAKGGQKITSIKKAKSMNPLRNDASFMKQVKNERSRNSSAATRGKKADKLIASFKRKK
jgi:hypothetical protein